MHFDEYQENCRHTDVSGSAQKLLRPSWMYYVLGLGGEAGEVLEKIKKLFRDTPRAAARLMTIKEDGTDISGLETVNFRNLLIKECGDVLWYMARLLDIFNITLEEVAQANSDKLLDRLRREVIHGDGDDR